MFLLLYAVLILTNSENQNDSFIFLTKWHLINKTQMTPIAEPCEVTLTKIRQTSVSRVWSRCDEQDHDKILLFIVSIQSSRVKMEVQNPSVKTTPVLWPILTDRRFRKWMWHHIRRTVQSHMEKKDVCDDEMCDTNICCSSAPICGIQSSQPNSTYAYSCSLPTCCNRKTWSVETDRCIK